ncbi:type II secretion system protein [Mollicutes bacterium LVI A0039]|nr:type II secretion system protein [Mollicutes bacterium LVI A0039]
MEDDGFTLIEMLISLLIISCITTLLVYNIYNQVQATNLETASKQIVTLLETARSCALANQSNSTVEFASSSVTVSCPDMQRVWQFDNMVIDTNFPDNTAVFYKSGVVNQGATIKMCNETRCQIITIGVGRSDVQIK